MRNTRTRGLAALLAVPTVIVALEVGEFLGPGTATASLLAAAGVTVLVGGYVPRDNVLRVGVYEPPV